MPVKSATIMPGAADGSPYADVTAMDRHACENRNWAMGAAKAAGIGGERGGLMQPEERSELSSSKRTMSNRTHVRVG
jgi:hypothetical protein